MATEYSRYASKMSRCGMASRFTGCSETPRAGSRTIFPAIRRSARRSSAHGSSACCRDRAGADRFCRRGGRGLSRRQVPPQPRRGSQRAFAGAAFVTAGAGAILPLQRLRRGQRVSPRAAPSPAADAQLGDLDGGFGLEELMPASAMAHALADVEGFVLGLRHGWAPSSACGRLGRSSAARGQARACCWR